MSKKIIGVTVGTPISPKKIEKELSPVKSVDESVAYTKTAPENALPYAEITEIGGRTRKCTNLLPYPYDDTTKTTNGITFTDNGDGSITVNGTATADAVFNLSRVWIKAMQKYFASGCPLGGSQTTYYLLPRGFGKDTGNGVLINGTSSDFSSLSQIVVTSGTTVNNLVFKPMLNEGPTALPYEPYYEGLRSAPVTAVESVGANLCPPFMIGTDVNDSTGATLASANSACTELIKVEPNTTYVWSNIVDTLFSGVYFYNENKQYLGRSGAGAYSIRSIYTVTPTINATGAGGTVNYIRFWCGKNVNLDGTIDLVTKQLSMLNKGSTALPYTPYFKRTLEIPEAVRALDGYGESNPDNADEYNAIVCEDGKWKYSHKGDIEDNVWTPLAAPEITDISDTLPADNFIQVEEGGTVTMVNEYEHDVPSKITFYESGSDLVGAKKIVGNLVGTAARAVCDGEGNNIALSLKEIMSAMTALLGEGE